MTLASTLRAATTMVHTVEQLTPTTIGPLSRALNALYDGVVLRETPGYTRLRSLAGPATATITSLAGVARFLAHHYKMNVIAVDVGASSTTLAGATTSGDFLPALFPQGGVGPGAGYILRAVGAPSILRWLAIETDENTVREYVLTRLLRRRMIPTTQLELELEYALAREAIRLALHAPGSRLSGLHPVNVLMDRRDVDEYAASCPHGADSARRDAAARHYLACAGCRAYRDDAGECRGGRAGRGRADDRERRDAVAAWHGGLGDG